MGSDSIKAFAEPGPSSSFASDDDHVAQLAAAAGLQQSMGRILQAVAGELPV
jgi:hypothetical protein